MQTINHPDIQSLILFVTRQINTQICTQFRTLSWHTFCRHLLSCTKKDPSCVRSHVEWSKKNYYFGFSWENTARFWECSYNAFRPAFPSATVTGCYFHLMQSDMRKVNEIGMKEDHERNDSLWLALRCLPSLANGSIIRVP